MNFFENYPRTDFHELNLDWLIKEWRKFLNKYTDLTSRVENVEQLIAEYKEYMDNYFDNLDITTEINNKIDEMVAGGQFAEILADFLPFVTPEMYGATGDGTTDDTHAFTTMASANIPVYIPNKSYVIDRQVLINKVIEDYGSYPNYEPLYKRDINIDLGGISRGEDTPLPVDTSYLEACTFLNNKYYIACYDYGAMDNATYVAIYDRDFNYIEKYYTAQTYGRANSIFNDDNKIWIDYDSGYHVRFNDDMTGATAFYNPSIRNYGYWNNTYYGIIFGTQNITIAELDTDMLTILSSFTVQANYSNLQSASVIDGVVYIATTMGNFYLIDIATQAVNTISYRDQLEIENFFKDDKGIAGSGHYYGMNGMYNIYRFNGGVPDVPVRYIRADGNYNIQNIYTTSSDRTGIYHVVNGTNIGLPFDEGDLISTDEIKLFISKANNVKYIYWDNSWKLCGSLTSWRGVFATIVRGMNLYIMPDGTLMLEFATMNFTNRVNSYTHDLSAIWSKYKWRDSYTPEVYFIGKGVGNIINADVYVGTAVISKTGADVYVRKISSTDQTTINCNVNGFYNASLSYL